MYSSGGGFGLWFPELSNRISQGRGDIGICEIVSGPNYQLKMISNNTSSGNLITPPPCEVVVNEEMFTNNMVLGVAYIVSFLLLGLGLNKISLRNTLTSMLITNSLCAVVIQHITNGNLLLAVFCSLIISCGVSIPMVNATAVDLFPTNLRGMAISVSILIGRMGTVSGANSLGFLLDIDCGSTFYGAALLALGEINRL